jgi:23S rRNA (adenine2503-C2)-methyltransferase
MMLAQAPGPTPKRTAGPMRDAACDRTGEVTRGPVHHRAGDSIGDPTGDLTLDLTGDPAGDLTGAERARILAKSALFDPPPALPEDGRRDLVGLSRAELAAAVADINEAPFRAKQLWHWIYHRGVTGFDRMSTIARPLQAKLAAHFVVGRPQTVTAQLSADSTQKFLFRFRDGQEAETVYIPSPEEDRGAVCVSSQVGCTLSCRFCHTGTQTLTRNLGAAEIVGQFMAARDAYAEWPDQGAGKGPTAGQDETRRDETRKGETRTGETGTGETGRLLSNIVFMGMGEPLYNYVNVAKAITILMDNEGIALSRRRITLSTSGVVPMMDRAGAELGVNLAVSLHAVRDDLRDEIVPLNRKYPIAELLTACRRYPGASNARRITFEYVMLKGVNDTPADARELVRLIAGMPAKVNLIPFNPWPGSGYETSTPAAIERFAKIVMDAGFASPVRSPRGRDILAACGQLRTESRRVRPVA